MKKKLVKRRTDTTKAERNPVINVVVGGLAGLALTSLLALAVSILIAKGSLPESSMKPFAVISCLIGAVFAAAIASRMSGRRTLPIGVGAGLSMFALSVICGLFVDNGSIVGGLTPALLISMLAGGALTGGLHRRRRRRKA